MGGFGGLQFAGPELLDRLGNRPGRARVGRDITRLQDRERLGADVSRDQRVNAEFNDSLACLYARPLGGIRVDAVAYGGKRARIRVDYREKRRPAKARVHCRLHRRAL